MDGILTLLKQLISCQSITPKDDGCQDIIINRLKVSNFTVKQFSIAGVTNSWIRYGNAQPLLIFAAHTDVVPPGAQENWQSPPFVLTQRENKLYGRGVVDMKGSLAAMIIACEKFVLNHPNFSGSIALLVTSDEEGPATHGTKKVIEALQEQNTKMDYCIIGEPSSHRQIGDEIRIGRRGSLNGKLTIHGKQGHVAYPNLAINPIQKSLLALAELKNKKWDEGNHHFPPTQFQITNIQGGTGALNVIPNKMEVLFNFRFGNLLNILDLKQITTSILDNHNLKYDLEWQLSGEPFLTKQDLLVAVTKAAIQKVMQIDPKLSTGGGTSDGRFIVQTGAEIVELGLLNASAHQVNEHTTLNDLEKLTTIYYEILNLLFLKSFD